MSIGRDDGARARKTERRAKAAAERKRQRRRDRAGAGLRRFGVLETVVVLVGAIGLVLTRDIRRDSSQEVAYAGTIRRGGTLERLELPTLEGSGTIDYATLSDKPLVINFFASWCPNCVGEMPEFEKVHQALGDRVRFLGVSQSDSTAASIALAQRTGITYPAGIDASGAFFRAAGTTGMPTTIFVRPGGAIADIWVGGLGEATLTSLIGQDLGVTT